MTDGFLHLTDAKDFTPVRIRISAIVALWVESGELETVFSFPGRGVAVKDRDQEAFTMISYGVDGGRLHGVTETVEEVEGQMADFYELAGMEVASSL